MRKEGGVGGSPAGRSGGAGSLFGRLLLALAADDAAGETDPVWDQQVEALAALVRPDGADFDPLRFAVAALSRIDDDVGGMGWLVAHLLRFEAATMGPRRDPAMARCLAPGGARRGRGSPGLHGAERRKVGDTRVSGIALAPQA